MKDTRTPIGRRLYQARKSKDYTQADLAEKSGMTRSQITKYEAGDVKGITTDKIAEFAEILEVSPVWLIGWDEEPENVSVDVSLLTSNEIKQVKQYIDFLISSRE
jgi:Predicted transcriptional regulators